MAQIMVAAKNGMPRFGKHRVRVRKGETTAHADHPIVTGHPHLWKPIDVSYATSGDASPPDDSDEFRASLDASGLTAWNLIRDLCGELTKRGIEIIPTVGRGTSDEVVAMAVVQTAVQALDDAGYEVTDDDGPGEHDDAPAETPDEAPSERRARVRDWARANGMDVSDRGPLPKDVERAYEDAHAAG